MLLAAICRAVVVYVAMPGVPRLGMSLFNDAPKHKDRACEGAGAGGRNLVAALNVLVKLLPGLKGPRLAMGRVVRASLSPMDMLTLHIRAQALEGIVRTLAGECVIDDSLARRRHG